GPVRVGAPVGLGCRERRAVGVGRAERPAGREPRPGACAVGAGPRGQRAGGAAHRPRVERALTPRAGAPPAGRARRVGHLRLILPSTTSFAALFTKNSPSPVKRDAYAFAPGSTSPMKRIALPRAVPELARFSMMALAFAIALAFCCAVACACPCRY